jgi:hypothetical protein
VYEAVFIRFFQSSSICVAVGSSCFFLSRSSFFLRSAPLRTSVGWGLKFDVMGSLKFGQSEKTTCMLVGKK